MGVLVVSYSTNLAYLLFLCCIIWTPQIKIFSSFHAFGAVYPGFEQASTKLAGPYKQEESQKEEEEEKDNNKVEEEKEMEEKEEGEEEKRCRWERRTKIVKE